MALGVTVPAGLRVDGWLILAAAVVVVMALLELVVVGTLDNQSTVMFTPSMFADLGSRHNGLARRAGRGDGDRRIKQRIEREAMFRAGRSGRR